MSSRRRAGIAGKLHAARPRVAHLGRSLHTLQRHRRKFLCSGQLRRSNPRYGGPAPCHRRETGGGAACSPRNSKSQNKCRLGSFLRSFRRLQTLDYAGSCLQARQVGGDYFDFLALGQSALAWSSATSPERESQPHSSWPTFRPIFAASAPWLLKSPSGCLRSVNRLFCENTPEAAYATFFFSEYDDQAGRLRYANCGHLSALVVP